MNRTNDPWDFVREMCTHADYVVGNGAAHLFVDGKFRDGFPGEPRLIFLYDDTRSKFINKYNIREYDGRVDIMYANPEDKFTMHAYVKIYNSLSDYFAENVPCSNVGFLVASFVDDIWEGKMYDDTTHTLRRLSKEEQDDFSNHIAEYIPGVHEHEHAHLIHLPTNWRNSRE